MKSFAIIVIMLLISTLGFAQDQQSVFDLYNKGEYQKVVDQFYRLYRERHTKFYFDYYIKSLVKLGRIDEALKAVNKEISRNPYDLRFIVDKIYLLELQGQDKQAQDLFKKLLRRLPNDKDDIIQIVNQFIKYRKYDQALKVLELGQKKTGQVFYQLLYTIYALKNDKKKVVDVLLQWLDAQPMKYKYVERTLKNYLIRDINNEFSEYLLQKLTERVKKRPKPQFYRLLIWFLTEKKLYTQAIDAAIRYTQKYHTLGSEVLAIGQTALKNDSLSAAQKAFTFLLKRGPQHPLYPKAEKALLSVYYRQMETSSTASETQLKQLEKRYLELLKTQGLTKDNVQTITELADLQAFYLNEPQKALKIIDSALKITSITNEQKGKLLIEKGKILLKLHQKANAILTFAQAAYFNKDNEVGDQAQLYQALTTFFYQDWQWAKKQFDRIKIYTKKLTANDAILYSEIIREAMNDSLRLNILSLYAQAKYYQTIKNYDSALIYLDSVIQKASFLADRALLEKYQIFMTKRQYQQAEKALLQLINNYRSSAYIDQAIYLLALLYEQKLNKPQEALKYFRELLFYYRGSIYTPLAREHYRKLLKSLNQTQ